MKETKLNRRAFLRLSASATAAAMLAACGAPEVVRETVEVPVEVEKEVTRQVEVEKEVTSVVEKVVTVQTSAGGGPVRGGTLIALVDQDWTCIDPAFVGGSSQTSLPLNGSYIRNVEDPKTGKRTLAPEMVADWEQTDDHVMLHLQDGIEFHDGTPWDAESAKWNLDRSTFLPTSKARSYLAGVDWSAEDEAELAKLEDPEEQEKGFNFVSKAIEIIDPMTVKIHMERAAAPFLWNLATWLQYVYPISPTAYNSMGKTKFCRNPVGAGPFRFVEWKEGQEVVMERNPNYWRKGEDGEALPYLDGLIYRLIIDANQRVLELKSGSAHFTELIAPKDFQTVEDDPNLVFQQSQTAGNRYLEFFDQANPDNPFQSLKLRRAFLYAMDRQAFIDTLGFGSGFPVKYVSPRSSFAYVGDDTGMPYYYYDKDLAQQFFNEAVEENPEIANSDGKVPIRFDVIDRVVDVAQAPMIKQMADAIGFDIDIQILERVAWLDRVRGGGPYEMAGGRTGWGSSDVDVYWRRWFDPDGSFPAAHPDGSMVPLMDKAASQLDLTERAATYRELEQMYYDDPWYAFLWQLRWNWNYNKAVTNFKDAGTIYWDFADVWLEEA